MSDIAGSRTDQYSLTLNIDGDDFGTWDKMTGGDLDSDSVRYKPGGMAPELDLGGTKSATDIQLSRIYDLVRDHPQIPTLYAKVGRGICKIGRQPLDVNGRAAGPPLTWTGRLKTVALPDADSEGSAAALMTLTISPNPTIA